MTYAERVVRVTRTVSYSTSLIGTPGPCAALSYADPDDVGVVRSVGSREGIWTSAYFGVAEIKGG